MQTRTSLPFQYVTEGPSSVATPTNVNPASWGTSGVGRAQRPVSSAARYARQSNDAMLVSFVEISIRLFFSEKVFNFKRVEGTLTFPKAIRYLPIHRAHNHFTNLSSLPNRARYIFADFSGLCSESICPLPALPWPFEPTRRSRIRRRPLCPSAARAVPSSGNQPQSHSCPAGRFPQFPRQQQTGAVHPGPGRGPFIPARQDPFS